MLQQRDFKKFEHRLVDVVQNNCPKKLAVLTSLLSESGVRLHEDLPETKMLLHTALLYNNDGTVQHMIIYIPSSAVTLWHPSIDRSEL